MTLFEWVENFGAKLKWYDFSLLKLGMLFFAFFLMTVWPDLNSLVMSLAWYWHLIIALVLFVPLFMKMFS
ncbi:hypothetical protein ACFLTH_17435 [Bacteroidota bacterium]